MKRFASGATSAYGGPVDRRTIAGQLRPAASRFEQRENAAEDRIVDRRVRHHSAQVVEYDGHRQRSTTGRISGHTLGRHVHLDVPAERRHFCRHTRQLLERRSALRGGDEPRGADAAVVQRLQFALGHRRAHHRDAARTREAKLRHGGHGAAVVLAVAARLHDDHALDAERCEHAQVVVRQRVRRRIAAVRDIRKARGRPERCARDNRTPAAARAASAC